MFTSVQQENFRQVTPQDKLPSALPPINSNTLLQSLTASVVIGLITVVVAISLGSLVYAGGPPSLLARGVGLTLFGAMLVNGVFALTSSMPGSIAAPQDSPAAILALVTASVVGALSATAAPERIVATVVAASACATLLTALTFFLLGLLNLGNLVRYLPYPVVGGFLASTGVLLIRGAFRSMTALDLTLATIPTLVRPTFVAQWLPGLALGVFLVILLRRYSHFLLLPALLLTTVALFYLYLQLSGTTLASAHAQGWLLAATPTITVWQPPTPTMLTQVDWSLLGENAGTLAAIPVICTISLLLNSSGLEVLRRRDVDFNRELRAAGIANLLSGLSGCHPSYVTTSLSALVNTMGRGERATAFLVALIIGATLFFGSVLLAYIPMLLLDGVLLFLGLSFITDWLFDAWSRLSRGDYLVLVLIVIAINGFGMLAGVGFGLALAVILFVIDYSRIDVVKHTLSGANYHSTVDRPAQQRARLRTAGERFHIFELQGYLFFGTADRLLDQVRQRIEAPDRPRIHYLLLDFRRVNGMDASAVLSFVKMKQLAALHEIILIFTHLVPANEMRLQSEVLTPEDHNRWRVFADLDHGVEWCEEQLIAAAPAHKAQGGSTVAQLAALLDGQPPARHNGATDHQPPAATLQTAQRLLTQMERCTLAPGDYLIRQGQPPQGLYFLAGQLTAQLVLPDDRIIRLRTMQPGVVVGELGLYTATIASASVVVDAPSVVYYLAADRLAQLTASDPQLAAAVHLAIARLVSARLLTATEAIEALKR